MSKNACAKVFVGKAIPNSDRNSCAKECREDERCQSITFNGKISSNPNVCVLNFGPNLRKISLPSSSGIASAPKFCQKGKK